MNIVSVRFNSEEPIIVENQPLSFILDQLSWQAGVYFSYNASLIDATKKYTVDAANKSLFTVLNQLFDARKFRFSELQNQIIISVKISERGLGHILSNVVPL